MASTINSTVAVAIVCKAPIAGQSKTRLSPPLRPDECAALSACFIRDLSNTVQSLADDGDVAGYAVYTPRGSEDALRQWLPDGFRLILQGEGDLGARLVKGSADLLGVGHAGVILVNSDAPTLPKAILRAAVDAVRGGDNVVLSPALDGGYTLIGLSRLHAGLFSNIPWSTDKVYRLTLERARELGLPVVNVPGWYDVDDAASLQMLTDELSGRRPAFADPNLVGADAPASRQFLRDRRIAPAMQR
ncbi:MAG: TIGR04282 family arsenosugar biosynthesis glycosyltransferase [Rhizobiales bacterium]|nr:TIGR04282 family arsenosugar biosynthesis glycosyltransferase [Hyphomicrobiales bacterium]